MPEFEMPFTGRDDVDAFEALPSFEQGYVEAMFFTSTSSVGDEDLEHATFAGLAPETLEAILSDCERFQREASAILADCYRRDGYSPEQAGRDFWFTRNGHGAGFWDREALEPDGFGDTLTGIAQDEFGNVDLYRGDDGQLYLL